MKIHLTAEDVGMYVKKNNTDNMQLVLLVKIKKKHLNIRSKESNNSIKYSIIQISFYSLLK